MIEAILFILLAFVVGALWASVKFTRWHRHFGTRFLGGLRTASYAVNVATLPIVFLTARRLILGPDAPPFAPGTYMLLVALMVLTGVFTYLAWRWRDLDTEMELEDQTAINAREDLHFGEQRRGLEEEHNEKRYR